MDRIPLTFPLHLFSSNWSKDTLKMHENSKKDCPKTRIVLKGVSRKSAIVDSSKFRHILSGNTHSISPQRTYEL